MNYSRRHVIAATGSAVLLRTLSQCVKEADAAESSQRHIATNTYPWLTFARRKDQSLELHTDDLLSDIAATGIKGYEPIVNEVTEFQGLGERLQKHGLSMESLYVNSTLHDESKVDQSVRKVVAIAEAASELGTRIIVANPNPIQWGGTEDKTDKELRLQARSLDRLGAELRKLGIALAYHNHDAELRQGGREFHHMMTATDPENVKLCLDAHWIFRGCGDSEVAVFDALEHYHDRIVELHLRQSVDGIWTEDFHMTGDIDYERLFNFLEGKQIVPHLVLEQAVEAKSPNRLTVVEAHRLSRACLERFA